jgi:hypothetical protein
MRFFSYNKGMVKPFRIKERDGTDKDLTGMTVKWYFIDRDGNVPTGNPITGSLTSPTLGKCSFTIPASFFVARARYTCMINITNGSSFDEDTDPFTVEVDNPRQRAS